MVEKNQNKPGEICITYDNQQKIFYLRDDKTYVVKIEEDTIGELSTYDEVLNHISSLLKK